MQMITPEHALKLILAKVPPEKAQTMPLLKAQGFVLAKDEQSGIDSPPFHQSAMDGYAIRFSDLDNFKSLRVSGELVTGSPSLNTLQKGTGIRVFTGAMIPRGADTVVMKEMVQFLNGHIFVNNAELIKKGSHIRLRASQIKKGKPALKKGTLLTPTTIAYLATLGVKEVSVYSRPTVAIIATGNELQEPGKPLKPGQIYESNTIALMALLDQMQFKTSWVKKVKDNKNQLLNSFQKALNRCDVLMITGGISVGEYDFVASVLKSLKVKTVFHKVAQKPGKPFYFGTKGKKLVFALPGNPASVMTCFYEYVFPALRKCSGNSDCLLRTGIRILQNTYEKKAGLTHFLKGLATTETVEILPGQESYLLNSFAQANCLVTLPADSEGAKKNEMVQVHFIDSLL